MMPPLPFPVVVIVLSEILTVVPSPVALVEPLFAPYEKTPFAPSAFVVMTAPDMLVVPPPLHMIPELIP